jgi:hypothetical protein
VPIIRLDWDPDAYLPGTEHPWTATPCGGGAAVPDTWSAWISWETAGNVFALADDSGVYIIEDNNFGEALYAGKALNFSTRFDGRSRVFHEFGLDATAIQHAEIRIATVTAVPNVFGKVTLAEHWLIRFLYCRDFAHPPNRLQNISATNSFNAPIDGLSIRFDTTVAPAYLHDAWAQGRPGWVAPVANIAGFDYAPNAPVLP